MFQFYLRFVVVSDSVNVLLRRKRFTETRCLALIFLVVKLGKLDVRK